MTQRYVQNAADGAALAGASELGNPDETVAVATANAASHAASYLDENLNLGMTETELNGVAATVNSPNGYCYPNPASCSDAVFQFWLYTPAPATTTTASSTIPGGTSKVYLNPQKYPQRTRSMFVRVDKRGELFFGRIVTDARPVIASQAIASPTGQRCAVAALKPRLDTPDNKLGIELNAAQVYVGRGDV